MELILSLHSIPDAADSQRSARTTDAATSPFCPPHVTRR